MSPQVDWVVLLIGAICSVLVLWTGYRASKGVQEDDERLMLRSGILAVVLTPSLQSSAPWTPAWYVLWRGAGAERLTDGLFPMVVMWPLFFALALALSHLHRHPELWHLHHRH